MADGQTDNRVIAHFDIDCFYAQSEELRCPSLRGRAVGVTQKFLVVTCNYVARSLGVPKMVSIDEAKRKLPTLVLVNGEDLTPYRADSKRILAVLRRFGNVERHGFDEGAVDITAQVQARLQSAPPALSFLGHVLGLGTMMKTSDGLHNSTLFNFKRMKLNCELLPPGDVLLLVGSQVVSEMRTAIEKETGFCCSCGVAQNKILAKLSSSLNKPSMQTCLLQGAVAKFLAPLSVQKIPGVGKQMHGMLTGMGVETIADLEKFTMKQLSERLGDRIALVLFNACRGQDPSPVQDKGPPKSISVEDSFRNCHTKQHAMEILSVLAPDLIRLLDEDKEETGRRPKSFTVKWRVHGTKWNVVSTSTQMPLELLSTSVAVEKRAFLAVDMAMRLLLCGIGESFHLLALNIGATNFVSDSVSSSPDVTDIRTFLPGQGKSPGKELEVISKRDARACRESFKVMASTALLQPSATFQTTQMGMNYGPQRKLQASTAVPLEDEYHPTNSSEEDEVDDLADQLGLTTRQNSLKPRDARTMPSEGITSSFQEQQNSQLQQAKLSNRIWLSTSGMGLSSGFPGLPGKQSFESGTVERTASDSEGKGANLLVRSTSMALRFSALHFTHEPPSYLKERHCRIDDAVPISRELLDRAHYLPGAPIEQCATLVSIDTENRVNTDSEETCCSIEMRQGRPEVLCSRGGATPGVETVVVRHRAESSFEGAGNEKKCGVNIMQSAGMQSAGWAICDKCGEHVEESASGRQEHADHHFALSLDEQERRSLTQTPESSRVESTRKREKVVHSAPPLKKSKSRNGTLDGFVFRLP